MRTSRAWIGWIALAACTLPAAAPAPAQPSLERLVAARHAVEEVYWRHRVWPDANAGAKPALGDVLTAAGMREKVMDALRKSAALEEYWQRPITPEQLQAEIDRMAAGTKSPEMLRELFAALGNDAALVAETLARPALADRLIRTAYAYDDRMHGVLRERAERALSGSPDDAAVARAGGEPSEITFVRRNVGAGAFDPIAAASKEVVLEPEEWNALVGNLAATFAARPAAVGHRAGLLPAGRTSGLQEDTDRFYVSEIRKATDEKIVLASVSWLKRAFDEWWPSVRDALPATVDTTRASYRLPSVPLTAGCDDQWSEIRALPYARVSHTTVWTGTEMIVWGGRDNTGDRYNPATDTWSRVRSDATAPSPRGEDLGPGGHVAVWTGTEMIVWGGWHFTTGYLNTGGRYNPATDTWTPTRADATAPAARAGATAVWTGATMIVWGGRSGSDPRSASDHSDGGRYDPGTDTWTPTRNDNTTPEARSGHTAVWTGTEMIIWGGTTFAGTSSAVPFQTGGRYDPASDTWTPTPVDASTPSARSGHGAVWTGSEMIVWGGWGGLSWPNVTYFNTGRRFDPILNQWTTTSLINAPSSRESAITAWTGSEMIIFGGYAGQAAVGPDRRYDPASDTWSTMADYPSSFGPRPGGGTWAGSELIVWGGARGNTRNLGGRYSPVTDSWLPTTHDDTPSARSLHTAVWTGSEMIVWGGQGYSDGYHDHNDGGRYDPATDSWTRTRLDGTTPSARHSHTAIWTGSEMIVWGGSGGGNSGGRYDPASDIWTPTRVDATTPTARSLHTAIWTGSRMVIWGGTNTGGLYDPAADSWVPTRADATAPEGRFNHTAVWTGSEMIVWGGENSNEVFLNSGGRYNPATDSWVSTRISNQTPYGRSRHTAIWTGHEMIVWAGEFFINFADDNIGGVYDPETDQWRATSLVNAPVKRTRHTAVWTGREMIVWGGISPPPVSSGGRYDPLLDSWQPTRDDATTPSGRLEHSAVWTGSRMMVWGGSNTDTGGTYCPADTVSACVDISSPLGKGSGTIKWMTTSETDLIGFNVVTIDSQGRRSQVNRVLIPCDQCTTGIGSTYIFIVPKHRSGRDLFIERVHEGGAADLFGPATKGCAP